jgi:hypothetical protein
MQKFAVVITSISGPNAVMKSIAEKALEKNIDFFMIGDTKTPADFSLKGCDFYSVDRQLQTNFSLAKLLPVKHYSRKNIGYLLAKNHDIIVETDDDNFPREEFWKNRSKKISASQLDNAGWTNVYGYFSDEEIWPRGFPLESILSKKHELDSKTASIDCPIQQGLADENPDVDAVYRMNRKLPINFNKRNPIALGNKTWCPFNSQNTTWFPEAFPLLYLPSYCSFRMTDIWRSFVAQRIAWTCGWPILFHESTVWQERNEHNLLKDFEDEIPGYLNNAKICRMLESLDLNSGVENISENLIRCYKMLTENNFVGKEEMPLVEAWVKDIN